MKWMSMMQNYASKEEVERMYRDFKMGYSVRELHQRYPNLRSETIYRTTKGKIHKDVVKSVDVEFKLP